MVPCPAGLLDVVGLSTGLVGTGLDSMTDAALLASCKPAEVDASVFFLSNTAAIENVRRRAGREPVLLPTVDCIASLSDETLMMLLSVQHEVRTSFENTSREQQYQMFLINMWRSVV